MRSVSLQQVSQLSPKIITKETTEDKADTALVLAVQALAGQFASAIASIPAPIVVVPRPQGSWVIDVARDTKGQLSKMTANFHETR